MRTMDWAVLWIGAAMVAAGSAGWFMALVKTKPRGETQTRGVDPVDFLKALKDVPVPNLLIGLGFLLIILAAGWVQISVSSG